MKENKMKQLALLIYPEFSIQEVANLMYMFRWFFDCKTVTFSSDKKTIFSEEGIGVVPEKTLDEFKKDDYYCLILPGCSDFDEVFKNLKVFEFLKSFRKENEFVIGAICGGPVLLSISGLLDKKKFTNSMGVDLNQLFSAVNEKNIIYAPVIEDGNFITAQGEASREFAIAIARKVGFTCRDEALSGIKKDWKAEDFMYSIPSDELEMFTKEVIPFFEKAYEKLK